MCLYDLFKWLEANFLTKQFAHHVFNYTIGCKVGIKEMETKIHFSHKTKIKLCYKENFWEHVRTHQCNYINIKRSINYQTVTIDHSSSYHPSITSSTSCYLFWKPENRFAGLSPELPCIIFRL